MKQLVTMILVAAAAGIALAAIIVTLNSMSAK